MFACRPINKVYRGLKNYWVVRRDGHIIVHVLHPSGKILSKEISPITEIKLNNARGCV